VCLYSRDQLKVSTINLGSCASFFALPNSVLNTDYEVVTWPPQSLAAQSVISILASVQDMIVRVIEMLERLYIQYLFTFRYTVL